MPGLKRRRSIDAKDETAATAAVSSSAIDPAALMRIKSLQLRARLAMEGFIKGIHRSPYHGFSVEFSEYRQYTPGDDLRYLDWRPSPVPTAITSSGSRKRRTCAATCSWT